MDNLVFHYCNIETFFAIITNRTLRLSDVVKSNDNLEVMWMKKILLDMVNTETISYENFNEQISKVVTIDLYKAKLMEKIESFFERKEVKSKFFAICFSGSESEDRLSQWRGYGDDGKGVAIGFNREILEKTKKKFAFNNEKSRIEFRRVEYKIERQKEIIRQFWREQINVANKTLHNIEIDFELWIIESFYKLYGQAIFMKSSFFEEENESRIVFEIENEKDKENKNEELRNKIRIKEGEVTIRNGNIVEYYDLDISKLLNGFIQKVILGPKCKVEIEDVKMVLEKYNYENVEIVWSRGSYR